MDDQMHIVDALQDVLDKEREALLSGKLDVVERLAVRKEELSEALRSAPPEPIIFDRLVEKFERNKLLLEAAAEGVRSVRDRIKIMREGPQALSTYNSEGQRSGQAPAPQALTRRA